jgi:hypothetical protein
MSRPTAHVSLPPDPRLAAALRQILFAGIALVLVIPAARGQSHWLGALPLWLVAMPAASLWALHRFPLPWHPLARIFRRQGRPRHAMALPGAESRRRGTQARRRCSAARIALQPRSRSRTAAIQPYPAC